MTRWIGVRDVAARYGIHPETLTRLVREGRAPVMPCRGGGVHGRRYKWREADVERDLRTASLTRDPRGRTW